MAGSDVITDEVTPCDVTGLPEVAVVSPAALMGLGLCEEAAAAEAEHEALLHAHYAACEMVGDERQKFL
jgi:hypothetical protein